MNFKFIIVAVIKSVMKIKYLADKKKVSIEITSTEKQTLKKE